MSQSAIDQDTALQFLLRLPDEELASKQAQKLLDLGFDKEKQANGMWMCFNSGKIKLAHSVFSAFLSGQGWTDLVILSPLRPGFEDLCEPRYALVLEIMSQALVQASRSIDLSKAPNALGSPLVGVIHHSRSKRIFKDVLPLAKDHDLIDSLPRKELLNCLQQLRDETFLSSDEQWVNTTIRRLKLMEVAKTAGPTPQLPPRI